MNAIHTALARRIDKLLDAGFNGLRSRWDLGTSDESVRLAMEQTEQWLAALPALPQAYAVGLLMGARLGGGSEQ